MNGISLPTMLIVLPLVGAILALGSPNGYWARGIALGLGMVELLLALLAVAAISPELTSFQLVEEHVWITTLDIHYRVGIDGLSALFLPMTALMFAATVIASWNLSRRVMPRLYFALLLFFEGVMMGIFCALDTILFFVFWELTLVPIYFMVSLWGIGPNRRHAAVKYLLFMLTGGVFLLFGLLLPVLSQHSKSLFDLTVLLATPLPPTLQWPVFILLLIGFGVKTPMVPLHTWLPTLAMEGPVAVTAIMTGLKLGAYGLIRFVLPLAPQVAHDLHWLLVGIGVVGIIYGALVALAQSNLRRMLAYSSISHVGLVVLGLASFTLQGIQGAIAQLLNFTLTTGGLFLLAGFIQQRLGSTDLAHMGGLARPMPIAASFFLLLGLASMGLPLTSGFPAELLLLIGALLNHKGTGLAALGGVILGAAYFLGCYRQAFLGPMGRSVTTAIPELLPREMLVLLVFGILILVGGIYPSAILDFTYPAARHWLAHLVAPFPP